MNLFKWFLVALGIVAVVFVGFVGAAIYDIVTSNPVEVVVEPYSLTLAVNASAPIMKGETLRFSGILGTTTYVLEDVNVTLWRDNTYIGYDFTDSLGYYQIDYVADTAGTFTFKTNATITS